MNWIVENKEWLFSGIGVVILLAMLSVLRGIRSRKAAKDRELKQPVHSRAVHGKGVAVHGSSIQADGDVNIAGGDVTRNERRNKNRHRSDERDS